MPKRIAAVEWTEAGRQDAGAYFSRGLHALRRILTLHHRHRSIPSYEKTRRATLRRDAGLTLSIPVTVQQVHNAGQIWAVVAIGLFRKLIFIIH